MSILRDADVRSAPLHAEDQGAGPSVSQQEIERLQALVSSLQSALGVAVLRLQEAGLPHQDLRAPLHEAACALTHDEALEPDSQDVEIGPFVSGMLSDVPLFAETIRFVFDMATDRIARLEVQVGPHWETAKPELVEAFRSWLIEENEDMIDHPENWELEKSDSLPFWRA